MHLPAAHFVEQSADPESRGDGVWLLVRVCDYDRGEKAHAAYLRTGGRGCEDAVMSIQMHMRAAVGCAAVLASADGNQTRLCTSLSSAVSAGSPCAILRRCSRSVLVWGLMASKCKTRGRSSAPAVPAPAVAPPVTPAAPAAVVAGLAGRCLPSAATAAPTARARGLRAVYSVCVCVCVCACV